MEDTQIFPTNDPNFQGVVRRTYAESEPWWPATGQAPAQAPDVIFVLFDDVGFASLGCFGSDIETPNIDALAANGLRYNNFHVTPMCSPTRACLLTGRNHHSVGMSLLTSSDEGFPGKRGTMSRAAGTAAEILRSAGYNTMCSGKWHLAQADTTTAAGPYDQWPLGRGFDRYYGFLDPLTDHFYPELVTDNHRVDPPAGPEDGYHLSADLVDQAIAFIADQKSADPEKPYFLYLAFGTAHSPHQAPDEYLEKYRGRYDKGWDEIRKERYERQLALGVIPASTELPPRNENVSPWDSLTDEEKRLSVRFQEAYAAMIDHTDAQIGRLVEYLRSIGRLDHTLIVLSSDNGASQEGSAIGSVDTSRYDNLEPQDFAYNMSKIDDIGTPRAHTNFPLGWAQAANTPLKRYKQETYAGGVRVPTVFHWPDRVRAHGEVRSQFHHVIDVLPTVLDVLGLEAPATLNGVPQMPLHGSSMAYTWDEPDAPSRHSVQYFELRGHRALWKDGWKAVAFHERGRSYDEDPWALYDAQADFSECHDLADKEAGLLEELKALWWEEASKYEVFPLDDRLFFERAAYYDPMRPNALAQRKKFTLLGGMGHFATVQAPAVFNRSFVIDAEVQRDDGNGDTQGVIVSHGSIGSGYSLYVKEGRLAFDYNSYGTVHRVEGAVEIPAEGDYHVRVVFKKTADCEGDASLYLNDALVATGHIPRTHRYMIAWQGLDLGRDTLSPSSDAYIGPFPFSDIIKAVTYELGDDGVDIRYESSD